MRYNTLTKHSLSGKKQRATWCREGWYTDHLIPHQANVFELATKSVAQKAFLRPHLRIQKSVNDLFCACICDRWSKLAERKNGIPPSLERKLECFPRWQLTVNLEPRKGKTSCNAEAQDGIKKQLIKFSDLKVLC